MSSHQTQPSKNIAVLIAFCLVVSFFLLIQHNKPNVSEVRPAATKLSEPKSKISQRSYIAGHSVNGVPILCHVLGDGDDVILIMATIHGNENAGTGLVHLLRNHLQTHPGLLARRRVVLMPMVNPDGFRKLVRYNSNGIDLNRNFPADNRQNSVRYGMSALSEPEALAIDRVLQEHVPSRIVTLHEPLNCIDYDGPGSELAQHMGMFCKLSVKKLGSRPGSLGSYAGETLGVPIITFELPRTDYRLDDMQLWRKYGAALLAAVTFPERP